MTSGYRGEGHVMQPGCTLQAHYIQVQAMCDALGFAAQQAQARELELQQSAQIAAGDGSATGDSEAIVDYLRLADKHGRKAEYWYGVFQGLRGLLRAIEGNIFELEQLERDMLGRVRWDLDPPRFMIPGFEDVQGDVSPS